jgi:hypothetical protein
MIVFLIKFKAAFLLFVILGNSNLYALTKLDEISSINIKAIVPPYTSVSVSSSELSFEILGTPGDYISTNIVTLTVDSNQSDWGIYAQATDLAHKDFGVPPLPAKRLSFSVNEQTFKPLDRKAIFFSGSNKKESRPIELKFKLKTTWSDTPGIYKGKVTISFFNNP